MTTLYLVRHGETVANAAQILQGWQGGELNETGKAQAHDVAEKIRNERIDVFVASDLRRAIQTCTIIASAKGVNQEGIVTTPLLRERDWGSFTGKFIPDLENVEWPDDVESLEHMKSRAQNFLTWVKTTYPNKVVLAVGHGIINKAIQSMYFKKPMNEIPKMHNAEVRILML
ncbi:MAG TPA: histidine phosphatase family protein [Prevotella sp.]|nr:histidine phosphatase family protein [Prevotella sp.]